MPREDQGDAVAIAVALADKLDTLVGFWAIDEKPTGSGDPYQLRRAALGVIRIVLENDLRLPMTRASLRTCSVAERGLSIRIAALQSRLTSRIDATTCSSGMDVQRQQLKA